MPRMPSLRCRVPVRALDIGRRWPVQSPSRIRDNPRGGQLCSPRTAMFHAFAQAFRVLFDAGQFLFEALRDLEHYSFSRMDPDFHRTIIEFSSAHFLDHKLSKCAPCVIRCRELKTQSTTPSSSINADFGAV